MERGNISQSITDLFTQTSNLQPLFEEIGEIVVSAVQQNFEAGGQFGNENRFGGGNQHWIPSRRARIESGKTLMDSGQLASSITFRTTATGIRVGSNKRYAAIHNFGGRAGRGGHVDIPARPFMTLGDDDLREINDAVVSFFSRMLGSR